jgi:PST family polysaccharide transporter
VSLRKHLKPLLASRAAGNFAWLGADRGIRLAIGVFVSSWTARYLGPQNFGLLSYALSLSSIFLAIAPLGIEGVAIRDIIWDRSAAGDIIGTSIGLRTIAAVSGAIAAIIVVGILRPHDVPAMVLVALLGIGLIGQSREYGELLFRADNAMSQLVIPRLILFFCLNLIKVGFVLKGFSVYWFAGLTSFEYVCSGLITSVILRRYAGKGFRTSFSRERSVALLRECWPLAVAAMSIIIYMKAGQLLVGGMLGDRALGIYSAAIRVPESAYFIPTILASSLLPGMLAKMKAGREDYDHAMLQYMRASVCVALAICLPLSLGAHWITRALFSRQYAEGAAVMAVYVWSLVFIFLGVARAQYLLNERRNSIALLFSVLGLAANIGLNTLLIPRYGLMGAAVSTVASQAFSAVFASWLLPVTRKVGNFQLLAIFTPWRVLESRKGRGALAAPANQPLAPIDA